MPHGPSSERMEDSEECEKLVKFLRWLILGVLTMSELTLNGVVKFFLFR